MKLSIQSIIRLVAMGGVVTGLTTNSTPAGVITTPSNLPLDLNGSNFTYPYPINLYSFTSQSAALEMAFLDVPPRRPRHGYPPVDPPVALLLHGKNFCSVTWQSTIQTLTRIGYRVIAPDQIGFCKSSKPDDDQFSLAQLALNTRNLLDALGIKSVTLIGHSLGGMLSTRFTLLYPDRVDRLVLVNAIGLEDYIAAGVPYPSIDANLQQERAQDYGAIRAYEQAVYYLGKWKPAYDVWARMLADIYAGSRREAFVRAQARVVDMVFTQPIAGEFERIEARTLVVVGEKDTTAVGKPSAPKEVQARLGRFDVLGREVAGRIPRGEFVGFKELGHSPQVEDPRRFHKALLKWLAKA
ncbi:hypothetical protein BN1723_010074, partial [Verticillium longisporum]